MSRLPQLSTPGRSLQTSPGGTPAGSGIPTPSSRRPRSSLGPGAPVAAKPDAAEMDQALKDVLRRRPPSSLGRSDDPDTPTQPSSAAAASEYTTPGRSLQAPRTPAFRPRTPSAAIATPTAASRPGSRPSLAAPRASLIGSTSTPSRRSSMSTSTTSAVAAPFRRPESRASITAEPKWSPQVGDRVRLPSHGYEGTLRYLGPTHIRDGIWAGVELEGGFQGKGRNDGSVDGYVNVTRPDCR